MSSGKVTLLLTFNPLEHEGAVFGVSVFGKDITESKRLEQALRESEGDLAEAQRVARIGSWAFNARSNEVVWSDELYRIFGLVRSEFGGTHEAFAECIHAEDRQRVLQVGKQARADGKPFDIEYRIVTPRGEQKVIEELGRPILNEAGQTVGLIGTAQDITERREAETELRNSRQQLRSLSARLESLREEERMRVAREIHDELGQMLTGLKLDLQWMEEKLGELPPSAASGTLLDRVVRSTELVDSVVVAVQNIAADLRPGVLDGLGLGPAMQYEARRFQENSGIACGVRLPEAEPSLSAQQSTALFRILQASLTNVARHANARKVEVELRTEAGFVILTVQDNGRGITEADIARPESLGLLGMKERAGLLGGEMIFEGNRGVPGTVVTARIPHTPPPPPMGKPKNEGANC